MKNYRFPVVSTAFSRTGIALACALAMCGVARAQVAGGGSSTGNIGYTIPYTYSQPASAGTVAMTTPQITADEVAIIEPAATLATLTVTLPACNAAADSHRAAFSSTQIVTVLTVNAASGVVADAPGSLAVGVGNSYICRAANTTWYRLS